MVWLPLKSGSLQFYRFGLFGLFGFFFVFFALILKKVELPKQFFFSVPLPSRLFWADHSGKAFTFPGIFWLLALTRNTSGIKQLVIRSISFNRSLHSTMMQGFELTESHVTNNTDLTRRHLELPTEKNGLIFRSLIHYDHSVSYKCNTTTSILSHDMNPEIKQWFRKLPLLLHQPVSFCVCFSCCSVLCPSFLGRGEEVIHWQKATDVGVITLLKRRELL